MLCSKYIYYDLILDLNFREFEHKLMETLNKEIDGEELIGNFMKNQE